MTVVIEVLYSEAAVFVEELCYPGIHEKGQLGEISDTETADFAEHAADGDTVGCDDQRLARVLFCNFAQSAVGALRHLGIGLGSLKVEIGLVKDEVVEFLAALQPQVPEILCFPGTQVYFPEAPVGYYRQVMVLCDSRGGKAGSVQVAGVHRIYRHILKTLCQSVPLTDADGGHIPVPMTLAHAVEVPLSLDVANYINFCHNNASCFLTICTGYSIIHWIIC